MVEPVRPMSVSFPTDDFSATGPSRLSLDGCPRTRTRLKNFEPLSSEERQILRFFYPDDKTEGMKTREDPEIKKFGLGP